MHRPELRKLRIVWMGHEKKASPKAGLEDLPYINFRTRSEPPTA
jgi:hypothetical protein